MHYKNGREAKNGDKVILLGTDFRPPVAGILYDAKPVSVAECGNRLHLTGLPRQVNCHHDLGKASLPFGKFTWRGNPVR